MNLCERQGCTRSVHGNGLCVNHYNQERQRKARRAEKAARPRACGYCGKPVSPDRRWRGSVSYCSRECKQKGHVASGASALAAKRHYYKSRYGFTTEEAEALLRDARCAICGTNEWPGRHNRPHIDHDHESGKVRGVLCSECNTGIGKFKDDPARLRAAVRYLTR